ncbi:MAG: hemin uptake protein HemP [Rhodobacteraceae bacterium]|nr:hemin uptake protein HemP [Paracoccaceae bacterium]
MNRTETSNLTDMSKGQADIPSIDARTLTEGGATATITLDDQQYTLRITRGRKLILTK